MAGHANRHRQRAMVAAKDEVLAGIHSVAAAVRAGRRRIDAVMVAVGRQDRRIQEVVSLAQTAGVPVETRSPGELDRMAGTDRHQGCCARVSAFPLVTFADILDGTGAAPGFLLVLDQVVDPHNLGALVRSADAAGVHGVVLPRDRSAGPTPDVSRISVGALEYVRLAMVVNLARSLDQCRQAGIWTVGLDAGARTAIFDVDLTAPTAVVVGAEASGIRPLVRAHCDVLATIPQYGRVASLNASVAGAVALFETIRQRRSAAAGIIDQ